jgi:hypothetical protein
VSNTSQKKIINARTENQSRGKKKKMLLLLFKNKRGGGVNPMLNPKKKRKTCIQSQSEIPRVF